MSQVIQSSMSYTTWKTSLITQTEIKADQLQSLFLEKGNAKLYNDEIVRYGELEILDSSGNKKSFFYVLSSLDIEMYEKINFDSMIQSV